MLTALRGSGSVDDMSYGVELVRSTMLGEPTPEALLVPALKQVHDSVCQGYDALILKQEAAQKAGVHIHRHARSSIFLASVAAGNFLLTHSSTILGLKEMHKEAQAFSVNLNALLLARSLNLAVDTLGCFEEAVKSRRAAYEKAENWRGKYDALDDQSMVTLDRLVGVNGDKEKKQDGSGGCGIYTTPSKSAGIGKGKRGMMGRVNGQNFPTDDWVVTATFPSNVCRLGEKDPTCEATLIAESMEALVTCANGGPAGDSHIFGSPLTLAHFDPKSGGETALGLRYSFISYLGLLRTSTSTGPCTAACS